MSWGTFTSCLGDHSRAGLENHSRAGLEDHSRAGLEDHSRAGLEYHSRAGLEDHLRVGLEDYSQRISLEVGLINRELVMRFILREIVHRESFC